MSAIWYYHRLRAMSPDEILHRVRFAARKRRWRKGAASGWRLCDMKFASGSKIPLGDLPKDSVRALCAEADCYLDHRWLFFGLDVKEKNINWHADPVSGREAPKIFGFDINHRDAESIGDIKIIWEKNRHHHLSVLSAAYALTGDERYSDEVSRQILSWIEQNPLFIGVNWTHPLEQGIRLIAWVWCERLLRGSRAHEVMFGNGSPVLQSIYQQQKFIAETYCRGSSANNHLIGEMAGLYISSRHFRLGPEAAKWGALSRNILEEEIVTQTFPSGLNREQAFGYHLFVLAFTLLAFAEADDFDESAKDVLVRMLDAIPVLMDGGGHLPRYGDADEGKALQLAASSEVPSLWLLDLGSRIFNASWKSRKTLTAELISQCIPLKRSLAEKTPMPGGSHAFADAGVYALVTCCGKENEIFVLADAGPHGYLSIAPHAHADALSFTLSAGGLAFLVDPGTYTYYREPEWRRYFRGTSAHNTVVIDGMDQSDQAGLMMWRRHAQTTVGKWNPTPEGALLEATHDGYERMGIIHERRLELRSTRLLVADSLRGSGKHHIELRFHFHPACSVEMNGPSAVTALRQGRGLRIRFPDGMTGKILHAEKAGGWYSAGFMKKEPACTLAVSAEMNLPVSVMTEIEVLNEY